MAGCAPSTVTKTLKRFREINSNQSRQKSGRPSKVITKINRRIKRAILLGQCENAVQVHRSITGGTSLEI